MTRYQIVGMEWEIRDGTNGSAGCCGVQRALKLVKSFESWPRETPPWHYWV